jgi:hypothetical protein
VVFDDDDDVFDRTLAVRVSMRAQAYAPRFNVALNHAGEAIASSWIVTVISLPTTASGTKRRGELRAVELRRRGVADARTALAVRDGTFVGRDEG